MDPSRQASYEHAKRWFAAEEKRQAELEEEQRKAKEQSIQEPLEETKQRIAATAFSPGNAEEENERKQQNREEALRHPTPAQQWNARRVRVAQELGLHPSHLPDWHVDYLFDRRSTAFVLGWKQAMGR